MCRAYLSPFYKGEEETYIGRANLGAVSLNLPKMAIEAKGDIDKFYELIDTYSKMVFDIHKDYKEKVGKQKGSSNPLFYCEGGSWISVGMNEEIAPVLDAFTSSLGYIGLEETIQSLFNDSLKNKKEFAVGVVQHLKDLVNDATNKYGQLFALYSTPAESLCYTWMESNKKHYGEIENVTDREYLTNSFHIPVWEDISVPEKIAFEAPFHHIATGGRISYNEFNYGTPDEVLEQAINFAMDEGLYYGVNVVSANCNTCGHTGDFHDECPKCGETLDIVVVTRVNTQAHSM